MTLAEFNLSSIKLEFLKAGRPELIIGLVTFEAQAYPPFQPDLSALLRMFPIIPILPSGGYVSRYPELSFLNKCYPVCTLSKCTDRIAGRYCSSARVRGPVTSHASGLK
jgi:hypothetical protein